MGNAMCPLPQTDISVLLCGRVSCFGGPGSKGTQSRVGAGRRRVGPLCIQDVSGISMP